MQLIHAKIYVFNLTIYEIFGKIGYQPNGQAPISSTDQPAPPHTNHEGVVEEYSPPRRLRTDEIPQIVNDFRLAAMNAIEAGKFLLQHIRVRIQNQIILPMIVVAACRL